MANEPVTLLEEFDIALDRYEVIKAMVLAPSMLSSCVMRSDLLKIVQDPDGHNVSGSNLTELKKIGLVDQSGQMDDDVRGVVSAAFKIPAKQSPGTETCEWPDFDALET